MSAAPLPEGLLTKFRERSVERLGRIETSWYSVVATRESELGVEIEREVHTLKGDARLLGFHDVSMLCHKLEDLLRFARSRDYVIPQTIDLLVAPLVGLLRLLLHKRADQPMAGIDLVEFSRQVDTALREAYLVEPERSADSRSTVLVPQVGSEDDGGHVGPRSLDRLASAASAVYRQSLSTEEESARATLREIWIQLARELRHMRSQPLASVLTRHGALVRELSQRLGKQVVFSVDLEGIAVGRIVAPVVEMAVTHSITNAIDHGMELPDARAAAGKDPTGSIRLLASMRGDQLELVVEDDGPGVDLEAIRRKAVEAGILRKEQAYEVDSGVLLEMLMLPNFTTRDVATESSGRGVGLDAVRTAVRRLGGRLWIETEPNKGTRVAFQLPQDRQELAVSQFSVGGQRFALPADWKMSPAREDDEVAAIDLAARLGLNSSPEEGAGKQRRGTFERDGVRLTLLMDAQALPAVADRLCPTGDEALFEVVVVGEGEALLVRPERLG